MDSNQTEQLISENRRLKRAVDELSILNEIATAINSAMTLDKIVELIIQKCIKHLNVEQAAVLLLEKEQDGQPFRTMIRRADTTIHSLPYRLDTQLTGLMLKQQQPILINDFPNNKSFQFSDKAENPIQSLVAVPLLSKGKMIGLIVSFNKKESEGFTSEDQRLLSIISTQSAQVIENARLSEEEQDLLRMQEEMRMAYDIQMKLMPKSFDQFVDYEIAAKNIPAREVGGDYYDFIPINENSVAFCLGDISGKGMPAALLMANLQATLHGQTFFNVASKECIFRSNTLLYRNTESNKFSTLFYGILDIKKHELCYCNAGHDPPFLFQKDNKFNRLKTGGIVLGFLEEFDYSQETISIHPGDLLLLYSDGVTESMDASEEEFETERLADIVLQNREESPDKIIEKIIEAVQQFSDNAPQLDDITLMIIKRKND